MSSLYNIAGQTHSQYKGIRSDKAIKKRSRPKSVPTPKFTIFPVAKIITSPAWR